jgi:hypothetical protein
LRDDPNPIIKRLNKLKNWQRKQINVKEL